MDLKKKHIHFIGIGGIGMSGLALILKQQGATISGCDLDCKQKSIALLKQAACHISDAHLSTDCTDPSIDLYVYSTAIAPTHPERLYAEKNNKTSVHRGDLLGFLTTLYTTIAVSGSHGKTTTSSLIGHILTQAQYDPTIIVGGHITSLQSNIRIGSSQWLVVEADESDRSFLKTHPTYTVIPNIDFEHAETYATLADIQQAFSQFCQEIPETGTAIICVDDPGSAEIARTIKKPCITYGLNEHADLRAQNIVLEADYSTAQLVWNNQVVDQILSIPRAGIHNVRNALAAVAVAYQIGISFDQSIAAIKTFAGVDRRFTFKGTYNGTEIFDDYGHHPEEIRHTLSVARKKCRAKLVVLFQPHRFSRTESLWNDFVKVLGTSQIDHLIITDIYPASEQPRVGITAERLVANIKELHPTISIEFVPFQDSFFELKKAVLHTIDTDDLLLLLGAGKVNQLVL